MRLEDEIERAVKHQAANDTQSYKSNDEITEITQNVLDSISNTTYDFSKSESIILNQGGNKRFVKRFIDCYSAESILCQYIKQILDQSFKVKYPNRNKTVRMLFDVMKAVKQMEDFTIVKFDFKNCFNSISLPYVFEKFLKYKLSDRFEIDLIENFAKKTKFTYAGFSTSNVIAEIIAREFDSVVRQEFTAKGLLFYERYIDDSVIVFNENVEQDECEKILKQSLERIFYDETIKVSPKCKTRFNSRKFCYISSRTLTSVNSNIDYLGYEFYFNRNNGKINLLYGITQAKRDKYNARIDEIINCYKDNSSPDFNNIELLRHRVAAFMTRTVYCSRKYGSDVWKVKGFISNYGELRYLLYADLVEDKTKIFLGKMVENAFARASLPLPYFIKGSTGKTGYNLLENMKKNITLLLVEHIGYDYDSLVNLCGRLGIDPNEKSEKISYRSLVRLYLIKTKVGY